MLIRDLGSNREVTRDAAVARLTVIGARAIDRLTRVADDARAGPPARQGALRALEAIGDPRAIDAGLRAAGDADEGVAMAGIGVARALLQTRRSADVVDHLTRLALDRARPRATRSAAIRALGDLRTSTVAPLLDSLSRDPDASVAALASSLKASSGPWEIDRALPDDPAVVRRALAQVSRARPAVPLTALHTLLQRLREREASEPASRRAEWTAARGAAHAALAARGSRIALYDLREALPATEPLPAEFLTALADIGDETCLEGLAAAYAKARAKRGNDWWRNTLADAFRAIVGREKITRRNAVMKKIEKRWPSAMAGLGFKSGG